MIRMPPNENYKINVFLKDGTQYLGKDIPPKPFGASEMNVNFWEDECVITIPMSLVVRAELYFEKEYI